MEINFKRYGVLDDKCKGGTYNPAIIKDNGEYYLIARGETTVILDYDTWLIVIKKVSFSNGEMTIEHEDNHTDNSRYIRPSVKGKVRLEDFRTVDFDDTMVTASYVSEYCITPCILEFKKIGKIWFKELHSILSTPFSRNKIEKNWIVSWEHTIYSLSPFVKLIKNVPQSYTENNMADVLGAIPRLSTNLIGNHYGFYHIVKDNVYYHGLFTENGFTPPFIDGKQYKGGIKQHTPYLTSCIEKEGWIYVVGGVNDYEIGMWSFLKDEMVKYYEENEIPFENYKSVLFIDNGIGDFICFCYVLATLNQRTIVYLRNHRLLEMASIFVLPNIVFKAEEDALPKDYIVGTNGHPQWHEKKHNIGFKTYYANQLIKDDYTTPETVLPTTKKSKDILFFPYAAWKDRTWDEHKWKELRMLFMEIGINVVICAEHQNQVKNWEAPTFAGYSLYNTLEKINSASLVICNESGAAHMAGLLGTKALVLSGWLNPKVVYEGTDIDYILNATGLQEITPQEVFNKAKELL